MSRATKRITAKITPEMLGRLRTAADLIGVSTNQFALQAALEKAEQVVEGESSIALTQEGSLWLLDRLENPPPRNPRFRAAQAHYRKSVRNADPSA